MTDAVFVEEIECGNLWYDLSSEELKMMANRTSIDNEWGITVYHTRVKSRSAKFTYVVKEVTPEIERELKAVRDYLKGTDVILVRRDICQNIRNRFRVDFFVTREYARLAHMFSNSFFEPHDKDAEPDIVVVQVPEWKETKIYIHPTEDGRVFTFCLGSDYYGETKMAALRAAMYLMREYRNGLGMHAGGKLYRLRIGKDIRRFGVLILGLSGTGKTTITLSDHGLKSPEGISIKQDDIMLLRNDSFAYGTENMFYIKTDNVTSQPYLFYATQVPGAIAENVWVDDEGEIDFDNWTITTNGRCIVPRYAIPHTENNVDLPRTDFIFFNTRRYDLPPLGRLISPEQAACYLMLGESSITSAEDPTRVGESKRVVAFNPFIVDDPHKEGNKFYEILKKNPHIKVFLINTGFVGGEKGVKIKPQDTMNLIVDALSGNIEWQFDPVLGYEVVKSSRRVEMEKFDPYRIYGRSRYEEILNKLFKERKGWLSQFEGLLPEIKKALR